MRFDLQTILGSKIGTSVDVNGFFVPANSLANHLRRFSEPALFNTEEAGAYSLTKSGSLARIKFRKQYFALTSRHQVIGPHYKFDQLCMVAHDERTLFTSHSVVFPEGDEDQQDDFDVLLFEFTELVTSGRLPASGWYDVSDDFHRKGPRQPGRVCCIGYPGYRNTINYDEMGYPRAPDAVWGVEVDPVLSGRLSFEPQPKIAFDPAGMSGAPVFGLSIDNDTPKTFFAGILTNASSVKFNFISFSRIKTMLPQTDS